MSCAFCVRELVSVSSGAQRQCENGLAVYLADRARGELGGGRREGGTGGERLHDASLSGATVRSGRRGKWRRGASTRGVRIEFTRCKAWQSSRHRAQLCTLHFCWSLDPYTQGDKYPPPPFLYKVSEPRPGCLPPHTSTEPRPRVDTDRRAPRRARGHLCIDAPVVRPLKRKVGVGEGCRFVTSG